MNCPACGAPITLKPDTEGFKCDYCHAVFFPGEEDDGVQISPPSNDASSEPDEGSVPQFCPVCNLPLVRGALGSVPVLTCTQCRGLLLPMHILPALIDQVRMDELRKGRERSAVQTPPDLGDLKRTIQCPQCHRRMETHFYAGPGNVIVDSCGDCLLIWLNRGELTRIAHAPDETEVAESDWS